MVMTEFKEKILDGLREKLGNDVVVSSMNVVKNNDVRLTGIRFISKQSEAAPILYFDNLYQKFEECGEDFDETLKYAVEFYEQNRVTEMTPVRWLTEYENVKNLLGVRLVNRELNNDYLVDKPYKEFLDLAVVFTVDLAIFRDASAVTLVTDSLFKSWGVSLDELYNDALENYRKCNEIVFTSMSDVVANILESEGITDNELMKTMHESDNLMYVLSVKSRIKGSGLMLYKDVLGRIAEQLDSDLIIIPSSIHELIILREDKSMEPESIYAMVKEVNNTQVAPEDILSYSVYHFSQETTEISIL